jgi:hypothetical protein
MTQRHPVKNCHAGNPAPRGFAAVRAALAVGLCLLAFKDAAAIGQSAVVTLAFPVGARPTAMGEAFTGLANDANAIFYNPAGLGQSPLTLSWKTHMGDSAFTAVAARSSAEFGARDYVWAGNHRGVLRFNGKIWEKGEVYLPEEDESLRSVALRYFSTDDKATIDSAIWEIRKENRLGMKRYDLLTGILAAQAVAFRNDSAVKKMSGGQAAPMAEPASAQESIPEPEPIAQAPTLPPAPPIGPAKAAVYVTGLPALVSKPFNSAIGSALIKSKLYAGIESIDNFVTGAANNQSLIGAGMQAGVSYVIAIEVSGQISVRIIDVNMAAELAKVSLDGKITALNAAAIAKKVVDFILKSGPKPDNAAQAQYPVSQGRTGQNNFTLDNSFDPRSYARALMLLTADERVNSHIESKILPQSMDAQERKNLADRLLEAMEIEDRGIADVTELRIPFTIAVRDTVTAMAIDASERLWVGTVNGLWRYHNGRWLRFSKADGLGRSERVTAISVSASGVVAVGTEEGLALIKDDKPDYFTSENGLPDSYVTSIAHVGGHIYAGTPRGLARISESDSAYAVAVFDTSSGLLSLGVTALFADSKGRLWIGGDNGVTIYSGARNWTRYRFPGSTVYSFAEQSNGTMWIGTNRGVVTHRSGKSVTDSEGKTVNAPEWKTYHSKNALKNDNIRAIAACGKDMWIATDGALHQYAYAEKQVLLFYEQLLPSFRMTDLWHGFPAVVIPTEDWGTLGFSVNYINMGDNEQYDEVTDVLIGKSRAWEGVFGISYGFPVKEDLSLGLNVKYVVSVLDERSGGVGQTFAIDAGVLKRNLFIDRFDVGFMLQNMGPSIYYMTPETADPIPFSLRLGLAYKPIQTPFHELTFVADAYREVVKNYEDKGPDPFWVALWTDMLHDTSSSLKEEIQEINVSLGLEYMYADFMALRMGFLGDYLGERFELSLGLGVKYANMNFDFSYIYSPPGFMGAEGVRDGQWRISFLFGL